MAARLLVGCVALVLGLCGSAGAAAASQRPLEPMVAQALSRALEAAEEDPQGALETLGRMMRSYRRRPDQQVYIMEQRAGLLMQAEQFDTAREEIANLLRDQPPDFAIELRLTYAKVLLLLDRTEEALTVLEQWRAEQESDPNGVGLFLLGYAYVRLERFEPAAPVLEAAIAQSRRPLSTWIELLAFVYARTDRADEAVALLEDLILRNPANARWWRHLGALYQTIDDVPKGTAVFSVIDELDGLTFMEARNLASMMGYLGMPYDGAALLAARLAEAPDSADESAGVRYRHLMLLARLWMSAREFDQATVALQEASALAEDGEPQVLLGQLHLHWERYDEALDAFKSAITAYREDIPPRLFYLVAVAAMNLDEPEEARLALLQIEDDEAYGERAARLMKQLASMRVRGG